ncbi:MAG TPA: polyprenyl synthetase family protein [Bacteroidales bacterium]|nr:polyprenyl synthetase family protein [Bacteroidales bacterium]
MKTPESYLRLLNENISELPLRKEPKELYEPMAYALTMGGKRIRPVLTLLACEMFNGDIKKALPAALAIETFHNFTLVHDDIMDIAPIRRGRDTVYKKWNTNIGILSGDAMLAKAFELISASDDIFVKPLVQLLSQVAIEVCEGQQLDMNFEHSEKVTIPEYLEMIRLKTAVLAGSSLKAGAIVAGASKKDTQEIYLFGENLGMAFQMQDDILDVFGDEKKFGKKKGGDIITKKKTYLYLKAHELAKDKTLNSLIYYFANSTFDNDTKVKAVSEIYQKLGIKKYAEKQMNVYYSKAMAHLKKIQVPETSKKNLFRISEQLLVREF